MVHSKRLAFFILLILFFFKINKSCGQAPAISYPGPQIYPVNSTIVPLTPTNTGGAVPPNKYGQVTTFVGTGSAGSVDGTGEYASISAPLGLTVGKNGNIFVGDYNNNLVREITPQGAVTTLAGNRSGHGAQDGNGLTASFSLPEGVTNDQSGNIYVADSYNNLIRKITPGGNVITIAGIAGLRGSNNGPGVSATFNSPTGVAVDKAGNIYVADDNNKLIRKIDPTGYVTNFAGITGVSGAEDGEGSIATFSSPLAIVIDNSGNLYIADALNNKIRKITPAGIVSTLAGTGAAGDQNGSGATASFNYPNYITIDASGSLYVTDEKNNMIRKITDAGFVSTLAGNGNGGSTNGTGATATFSYPGSIAFDGFGSVYVGDISTFLIRKISLSGYTIDKPLPPGLVFDQTTGTISGGPATASPPTDYNITAYNAYGSSTTTVNITITDPQTITLTPILLKTVCDADFDPGATSAGAITYSSSNLSVATAVSGKIHVVGAGTSIITASNGNSTATATLTVAAALTPSVSITPAEIEDCKGSAVTFVAIALNGGSNPLYQWQVNGQDSGPNNATFVINTLNNGDKITCILTSSEPCKTSATATSNTAMFTSDPLETASVSITSSKTGPFCAGTSVTFAATAITNDDNAVYEWQLNGLSKGTNSPIFTINNLANGDIITCILNSGGKCLTNPQAISNAIIITLNPASVCSVIIPNAFTPNGDLVNDFWNITSLQNFPGCTVSVYNRFGALLFYSIDYPKAWDGTYKGSVLPSGTYYYIVDLKNKKKPLSGFITILK